MASIPSSIRTNSLINNIDLGNTEYYGGLKNGERQIG
jgi:hypothetical protein